MKKDIFSLGLFAKKSEHDETSNETIGDFFGRDRSPSETIC